MAKKAATKYLEQDGERKKAMLVIDQAIAMLGPVEKVKGSPHIQDSVSNMKKVIE